MGGDLRRRAGALRRLTPPPRRQRILCYVVHYYRSSGVYAGTDSAYVGKSSTSPAAQRKEVVARALKALRALPHDVDVKVCGVPEAALVPIDVDLSSVSNPQHFAYAAIERLVRSLSDYDWFLCLEDDVLLTPDVIERMIRFERHAEINEVLLPNRLEVNGPGLAYCVDLLAVPGWHGLRRQFEGMSLDIATNPHSGLAFLSRRQLDYAVGRVHLTRRDVIVGGYLESALANLHEPFLLWRTRDDAAGHHVVHLDHWTTVSRKIHLPGITLGMTPAGAHGYVDSLELDGVTCRIEGWAVSGGGPDDLDAVRLNGNEIPGVRFARRPRPDVEQVFEGAGKDTGFQASFSLLDVELSELTATTIGVSVNGVALTAAWPGPLAVRAARHAPRVPEEPALPAPVDRRVRDLLGESTCYLEYGARTTVLAARLGVRRSYSVEGDASWLSAVEHKVREIPTTGRQVLLYADVGPVDEGGYPLEVPPWSAAGDYILQVWRRMRNEGMSPDTVLIGGRFRVACFLATLLHARPGTRILFADYLDAGCYQLVHEAVAPTEFHDRWAEFVVPEEVRREEAWTLLAQHAGDAR